MKYIHIILAFIFVSLGLVSCDKNENFEILPKEESFQIITPVSGSVIVLNDDNLLNNALFISWDDPNATTDKTYTIEVAETGTDFETPVVLGTAQGANFSMNVRDVNVFLLENLGLDPDMANSLDVRVSFDAEMTQTISVVFTPVIVEYTEFSIYGSFTNDWDEEAALPMNNYDFNKFDIIIDLAAGDEFKFLTKQLALEAIWGEDANNMGMLTNVDGQNIGGYDEGGYKISIDLSARTFAVVLAAPDNLFLVGSLTGWDPATSLPFNNPTENIFTLVVELNAGDEFKFLPTNTGWDGDWGEDPANPGSIIQEGEQNVSGFDAGKYLVTVDFNSYTFSLTPANSLYLVGSLTGWDPATSLPMAEASLGVFSIVLDLPAGAEFKFLPTNTGWDGDWGADAANPGLIIQEGEQNISGYDAGTYVIAVNFNTLTYSISSATEVPASLYLVGSFNGWSNDASNPQFTEVSAGVYQLVQTLVAADEFKFVPVAGSWDNDWGQNGDYPGVLEQNSEQNIPSIGDGDYLITVDFNQGTIAVQ